jgi:predicted RNase H-like HicB family nuclease
LLTDYIRAAMHRAKYEILEDDGSFYGEIPGFQGVYANAATLEACREELESVLQDWILVCVSRHVPTPVVDGIHLNINQPA